MWIIDKQFDFCYGHRVYTQKLDAEYCENKNGSCKCRHLHGHQGRVQVFLESEILSQGMVTDFNHLGWLKNFIDDNIDHKFIIDENDPLFNVLVEYPFAELTGINMFDRTRMEPVYVPETSLIAGHTIKLPVQKNMEPDYEMLESYFIVDFIPTSENLSKWLYDVVSEKMKNIGVSVSRIDWWETPKSRSSYLGS